MIVDLHTHSNYSDGILSPRALMSRAKSLGVDIIALTDHDTVAGIAEAEQAAGELGLTLVPGIELSSRWGKVGVHIVGLNIDCQHPALVAAIEYQQHARRERNSEIAVRLEKLGLVNVLAEAEILAGDGGQLGRPHFAQLLIAEGRARDMNQAFKKYLGAGKRADVAVEWLSMEALVTAIHQAGGLAVLAHPAKYNLTRTKLRALVSGFAEAGGDALEVISGQQPAGLAADLSRLAADYELSCSCGSDFHHPERLWQELGRFEALPAPARLVWPPLQ
ncbi:MAG TPA: PHP domain-containing protein [Cellvibrionaceae bacterium]